MVAQTTTTRAELVRMFVLDEISDLLGEDIWTDSIEDGQSSRKAADCGLKIEWSRN